MLKINDTVFVLIDVQGKLADVMYDRDNLYNNLSIAIQGMKALGIPIIWLEQIPEKLGPTIPELTELLKPEKPIAKSSFSCTDDDNFTKTLKDMNRQQVVLAGIEAHVCVYQTARSLLESKYTVEILSDAVSSRTAANKSIGLDKARTYGAGIASTEMVLFELMKNANHPSFRDILKIVK